MQDVLTYNVYRCSGPPPPQPETVQTNGRPGGGSGGAKQLYLPDVPLNPANFVANMQSRANRYASTHSSMDVMGCAQVTEASTMPAVCGPWRRCLC